MLLAMGPVAALVLTPESVELRVGDRGTGVAIRIGRFQAVLRPFAGGMTQGYVRYHARRDRLGRLAVVAAAGPAASLAGGLVAATLASGMDAGGVAGRLVGTFALCCIEGVFNLIPARTGCRATDGAQLLAAWRLARLPAAAWGDPNAATSVAPPGRSA